MKRLYQWGQHYAGGARALFIKMKEENEMSFGYKQETPTGSLIYTEHGIISEMKTPTGSIYTMPDGESLTIMRPIAQSNTSDKER